MVADTDACSNYHPRLQPADGRCFACGSSKHSQSECPRRDAPEPSAKQKAQARKAQVAEEKPEGAENAPKASGKAATPSRPAPNAPNSTPKSTATTPKATPTPRVSALGIESASGLLDGGATHALRAALPGEWELAKDVEVSLATGKTRLRINALGTILTQDPCQQPILPLGVAIEHLRLKVSWIGEVCTVTHPHRGRLKVVLRKGCPEVSRELCLDLIRELEAVKSASYGSVTRVACMQGLQSLSSVLSMFPQCQCPRERVDALRTWFVEACPEVPPHLVPQVLPYPSDSSEPPPLNRHARKRLRRGGVLLHFCSGKQTWSHESFTSTLNLDLQKGHDLLSVSLFHCLLTAATNNAFDGMLGGPPCRTLTRLRHGGVNDEGPGGCRGRYGHARFGLAGIEAELHQQVDGDSILLLRFLLLTEVMQATKTLRGDKLGYILLEHPADPASYVQAKTPEMVSDSNIGGHRTAALEFPSIWVWPEVQQWIERLNLHQIRCDQGALGGESVKPTSLATTSGNLWERLQGIVVPLNQLWSVIKGMDIQQRLQTSKSQAQWAPGMVQQIKASLRHWKAVDDPLSEDVHRHEALCALLGCHVPPSQVGLANLVDTSNEPALYRTRAEIDRQEWIDHCRRGHVPWRRDCRACVQSAAYPRPHRRQRHPHVLNLQCDLAGPFVVGEDVAVKNPRHIMVATYSFPTLEIKENTPEPEEEDGYDIPEGLFSDPFEGPLHEIDPEDGIGDGDVAEEPSDKEADLIKKDCEKWDTIIAACKQRYKVVTLTFIEILPDKSAATIVSGLSRIYSRLRSKGFPVLGLFTDRGGEFVNKPVRVWAEARDLLRSTTMPESPASNGRCERALALLKRGVRGLLQAHQLPPTFWPHASRYIGEIMTRQGLEKLGQRFPPLHPFYARTLIRARTWNESKWSSRAIEGRLVAPSPDVNGGWCVRAKNGDQTFFYVSTLPYVSLKEPEEAPTLEGSPPEDELAEEVVPKTRLEVPRRMVGKTKPAAGHSPGSFSMPLGPTASDTGLHPASSGPGIDTCNPPPASGPATVSARGTPHAISGPATGSISRIPPPASASAIPPGVCEVLSEPSSEVLTGLRSEPPPHRVTSKTTIAELSVVEVESRDSLAQYILQHPALDELGQGNRKIKQGGEASLYAAFGAFQHGGVVGVTKATGQCSDLVECVCRLLQQDHPNESFTSFVVSRNSSMPVHQDRNNDPNTCNLISPLQVPHNKGGIWMEVKVGDPLVSEDIRFQDHKGQRYFGCVIPLSQPVRVRPDRWHCTADWQASEGDRILVVGYTIKNWTKLPDVDRQKLFALGFLLPNGQLTSRCAQVAMSHDNTALPSSQGGVCVSGDQQSNSGGRQSSVPVDKSPEVRLLVSSGAATKDPVENIDPDSLSDSDPDPKLLGSDPTPSCDNQLTLGAAPITHPNPRPLGFSPPKPVLSSGGSPKQAGMKVPDPHVAQTSTLNPLGFSPDESSIRQMASSSVPAISKHTSYREDPRTSSGGGDTQDCFCSERFCAVCSVKFCPHPGSELSHKESKSLGIAVDSAECGVGRVKVQLAALDVSSQEPALTPVIEDCESIDPEKGFSHVQGETGSGHTRRWYDSLPEDPGERFKVEGGLIDRASDDELENKIQSLDAARLCLISAVREEENCLGYEAAKGEGEGTLNALREAYHSLHLVEEQLVELQNEQTGCLLPRVASASPQEPEVTPEILHTHTVSLEEVYRDLSSWVDPMKEEVDSLETTHNALSTITREQIQQLEKEGKTVLWVPSKIVPTIKAGTGRKKARIVACGNFLSKEKSRGSPTLSRSDVFTSSLDSLSLRLQLALASLKKWTLIAIDVKTAFLTAPIGGG